MKFFEHIFPYHLKPRSASITSTTSSPQHTNTTSASSYTFLNWLSHNSLAPNVVVDIPSTSTEFQDTSHISDSDIHNSPLQSIYETASDIHNSEEHTTESDTTSPVVRKSTRVKSRPTW